MENYIKIFEAYDNLLEYTFQSGETYLIFPNWLLISSLDSDSVGRELGDLGLANDRVEINDHSLDVVKLKYTMTPIYADNSGIHEISFELKYVYMLGSYAVWDEEQDDEIQYDFEIEDSGPFEGRVNIEFGSLPFIPNNIDVDMTGVSDTNKTPLTVLDTKKFKYSITIGK